MIRIVDNAEEFLLDLQALAPDRKQHVSVLGNKSPWAESLHDRDGFSVINEAGWAARTDEHVERELSLGRSLTTERMEEVLHAATEEEVRHYQRFGDAWRPPVHPTLVPHTRRPAHVSPLNWGDVTTDTASSYYSKVNDSEEKVYDYEGIRYQ